MPDESVDYHYCFCHGDRLNVVEGIPGESMGCITLPNNVSVSPGSNVSLNARAIEGKNHARGHTLVVPASATGSDSSPVTTVVSGSFTL